MHQSGYKVTILVAAVLLCIHSISCLPVRKAEDGTAGEGDLKVKEEGKDEINVEMAKRMKKIPIEKLKPVDHVDGMRMEHDGHVNKDVHKELFLGEAHDEFKTETFDEAETQLEDIIKLADTNKDDFLSWSEMESLIRTNLENHFKESVVETEHIFKHLDPDGDGYVKWSEYYAHFLLSLGFEPEKVAKHVKDYDAGVQMAEEDMYLEDKEMLVTYKFKWTDADMDPIDNMLSKEEFKVFRHPELSLRTLQTMVENIISGLDTNRDNMVSSEEFAALPPGEVEGEEFQEMDRKWQEDRRKEFKAIIDINHDGQATAEEFKRYMDPTNPLQAKIETNSLLSLMDENKDGKLSVDEIMQHSELFITSKLVNFAANVHDEF